MSSYRTPFDLPVRYSFESGLHIENEFLYGLYESLTTCSAAVKQRLSKYYYQAKALGFPNHIIDSVPEKELSHDQVTAYSCYSYMKRLDGHLRIWLEIKKGKLNGKYLHPRDLLYLGLLNNNLISIILVPILWILCFFSMFIPYRITKDPVDRPDQVVRIGKYLIREKLSGELLWILRLEAVKRNKGLNFILLPCKVLLHLGAKLRFGSIDNMIIKYFQNDPNNPIVKNLKNK